MKKWGGTSVLIIILLILTVLGAVNYFAKPIKKWQMNQEKSQVEVPKMAEVTKNAEQETPNRLIDKLSAEELVWQVMAVPVVIDNRTFEAQGTTNTQNIDSGDYFDGQTVDNEALSIGSEKSFLTTQQQTNPDDPKKLEDPKSVDLPINLPATSPGALTIFGDKISSSSAANFADLVEKKYANSFVQPWLAVDHEGGSVQRLSGSGFTNLPSWQSLCQASTSAQLDLANRTSNELAEVGIDLVLAPVIDVATRSAVLGNRVCSGNPDLVASVSANFITSYLQAGMLPVLKHFPGIGRVGVDLHKQFGSVAIRSEDVKPFHVLLSQFPLLGVMTTHVAPEKNSQEVCSRAYTCVSELTSLYPKALVVSDALDMKSALFNPESSQYDTPLPQAALEALGAGNDLLLFGPTVSRDELLEVVAFLQFAADRDPGVKERLELAAEKVLSYKEIYK